MRSNLYKVIDAELKEFKWTEISKLATTKLTYMSDLYEIKCNIELRLAELDTYRSTLSSEMKWKSVISNILTPDYESTLLFVFSKAEEIEEDSIHYSKSFLQ